MSELEAKIAELDSLKKSYEEFIESSAALEKELEDALNESETKCNDLIKKKAAAEEKYTSLYERYLISGNQLSSCQKELSQALERVATTDQKRIILERRIDELEESVRILEATEEDLTHKLQRAEEDLIFLQSDIEDLKAERIVSESRLKAELTDIQAELAKFELLSVSNTISNGDNDGQQQLSHCSNGSTTVTTKQSNNQPHEDNEDEKTTAAVNGVNVELIEELELEIEELNERLAETELQNQQLNEEVSRLADELILIHEKKNESSNSTGSNNNNSNSNNDNNDHPTVAVNSSTSVANDESSAVDTTASTINENDTTRHEQMILEQTQSYEQQITELKFTVKTNQQAIDHMKIERKEIMLQLNNKMDQFTCLESEYQNMKNNLLLTNQSSAEVSTEIASLNQEIATLNVSLQSQFAHSHSLQTELELKTTSLEILRIQCTNQETEIQRFQQAVSVAANEAIAVALKHQQEMDELKQMLVVAAQKEYQSENSDNNNNCYYTDDKLAKEQQQQQSIDLELLSKQWLEEKVTLQREIELLRGVVSKSLSSSGNHHLSPEKQGSSTSDMNTTILNGSSTSSSKNNYTIHPETPVCKAAILDAAEINRQAVEAVIASGDTEKMKALLKTKMSDLESMRVSNGRLLQKLQAARGNIQVCCRARPPSVSELASTTHNNTNNNNTTGVCGTSSSGGGGQVCIEVVDDNELVCFDRRTETWKPFVFDRVWKMQSSQADVFADVEPLVLSVVEGYNTCILAYGQTSSGKTFTMNGYGEDYGVSYRTLKKLFEVLNTKEAEANATRLTSLLHQQAASATAVSHQVHNSRRVDNSAADGSGGSDVFEIKSSMAHHHPHSSSLTADDATANTNGQQSHTNKVVHIDFIHSGSNSNGLDDDDNEPAFTYSIEVSMMEIYNDQVYDLLSDTANNTNGNATSEVLEIRQMGDGQGVHVPGLKQVRVNGLEDVLEVFDHGSANRATAATGLNEHSSRSHSILVVDVSSTLTSTASTTRAKLFLVDLAGSERAGKSGVTGVAMKETQHINKSLSALGDVMEALDQKAKYVPYRNSKLTYLLQDSLGGNSRTMMIVTVCPTDVTLDETLFTLNFASRVRNVSLGVARRNVNAKNLEEALKVAKTEIRESKKKRMILEEGVVELKRQLKKINEKLILQTDTRLKTADEMKKSSENHVQLLTKSNQDLLIKYQDEKEAKQKIHVEYETLQKAFKKATEHLKEVQREREVMAMTLKQKEIEREKEKEQQQLRDRERLETSTTTSALSRPAVRMSNVHTSVINSSIIGPPLRTTTTSAAAASSFVIPSAAMRPVRRVTASTTSSNINPTNTSAANTIVGSSDNSNNSDVGGSSSTYDTSVLLLDTAAVWSEQGNSKDHTSNTQHSSSSALNSPQASAASVDSQQSQSHQQSYAGTTSSARARIASAGSSSGNTSGMSVPPLNSSRLSMHSNNTSSSHSNPNSSRRQSHIGSGISNTTTSTSSSSKTSARQSMLPTRHHQAPPVHPTMTTNTDSTTSLNTSINAGISSPNPATTTTNAAPSSSSSSAAAIRSGIAVRSKEALLRHQERMEKFREKQASEVNNSKANLVKGMVATAITSCLNASNTNGHTVTSP